MRFLTVSPTVNLSRTPHATQPPRFKASGSDADPKLLRQRVSTRRSGPSDATVDVLWRQLQRKAEVPDWRTVDADASARAKFRSNGT